MTQKNLAHAIETYSGKRVWPLELNPEDVSIMDLAHSLSMQCRFNGHTDRFYSVAQHSVLVSRHVPQEYALHGLLHDAAESYIGDIPKSVKFQLENWNGVEDEILESVGERFGVTLHPLPEEVEEVDARLLRDEARLLLNSEFEWWSEDTEPLGVDIAPVSHVTAKELFLTEYERLTNDYDARRAS